MSRSRCSVGRRTFSVRPSIRLRLARFAVPSVAKARVLVVGDVMLDRYWFGDVERISPEAPVPVVHFTREDARYLATSSNDSRSVTGNRTIVPSRSKSSFLSRSSSFA
jgi:hypothetical protein